MEKDQASSYDFTDYYGSIGIIIMTELDSAVEKLIAIIKDTEVYMEYERQKEKVNRIQDLKAQIDAYRIRNYEIQNLSNEEDVLQKIEDFEREYETFRENPIVSDFLAAELALCRMMQEINIRLTAALDFDLTL